MTIYAWRCKNDGCEVDEFDSEKMRDETCPSCGQTATRIFSATTTFHPSKTPAKLRLNSKNGKRGWR